MAFKVSDETKVGALAAVSIAILILGFSVLQGENLFSKSLKLYAVYDEVDNLKESDPVMINGYTVGQVSKLSIDEDNLSQVIAEIKIDKEIKIPKNSAARIISSDLLGEKAIELVMGDSPTPVEDGDTIRSETQESLGTSVRKEILPVKIKAENLLSSMDSVLNVIQAIFDERTKANIDQSLRGIQATLHSFNKAAMRIDQLMERETENIEAITTNIKVISDRLKRSRMISNLEKISDSLRAANLTQTINRTDTALAQFATLLEKVNKGEGSLGLLLHDEELYRNLNESAKSLDQLLQDFNEDRYIKIRHSLFGGRDKKKNNDNNGNSSSISFKIQLAAVDKPVENDFKEVPNLQSETSENGLTRYLSGPYNDLNTAVADQSRLRNSGYKDAFIVAYNNGSRISMQEALEFLAKAN